MNVLMQQLINHKINSLTEDELLHLANQHQITLSTDQAHSVIVILNSEEVDVANEEQVNRILYRLQTEIDEHVSTLIQQLLQQFSAYL